MMKWYKILSIDDETNDDVDLLSTGNKVIGRYVMVQGPPWPENRLGTPPVAVGYQNLRVAILPGIVDVYTRVMQMNGE
jgi:hypothetical protein